jgi:hypothetical protein
MTAHRISPVPQQAQDNESMNLMETLRELHAEKEKIVRAIEALETLCAERQGTLSAASKRGRKFMPVEERRQVSERMRGYWAKRRSSQPARASKVLAAN